MSSCFELLNFSLLQNVHTGFVAHPATNSVGIVFLSKNLGDQAVKLTTPLLLQPRLRMSGAVPLLPHIQFRNVDKDFTLRYVSYNVSILTK